jgi:hypothetical protein
MLHAVLLLQKWIFGLGLLGSPGEHEPAVERGGPVFAATAGFDPEGVSHVLDDITQTNILVANEPWKARSVGLGFALAFFLGHGFYLLIT